MSFRRVFVVAALAVVVLGNLAGLFLGKIQPVNPLIQKAYADDDPEGQCSLANGDGVFPEPPSSAVFNDQVFPAPKTDVALTLANFNQPPNSDPTAALYRKKDADTAYTKVTDFSLTKDPGSIKWTGSYSDNVGTGVASASYIILAKTTGALNEPITKCFKHQSIYHGGSGTDHFHIISWFKTDVPATCFTGQPYEIKVFDDANSQNQPPKVTLSGSNGQDCNNRPPIVFKLISIHSIGALDTSNTDWLTFAAYDLSDNNKLIENFYLSGSNGGNAYTFIYGQDKEAIKNGDFTSSEQLSKVNLVEERQYENGATNSTNYVFRHLFNDAPDGSKNCNQGTVVVSRPKAADHDSKIVDWHTDDAGYARELNGNCLNINKTAAESWAAWWGVEATQNESLKGGGCAINVVTTLIGGIGATISRVIACTVQYIFTGVISNVVKIGKSIGGETDSIESRFKDPNSSIVEAWKLSLGLLNIIVVVALLAIAFANILHLNINTYAAKKALPGLVIGVIGANASLLLIRFLLDVAQALMQLGYEIVFSNPIPAHPMELLVGRFIAVLGFAATSNDYITISMSIFALVIVVIFVVYFVLLIGIFIFAMIKRLVFLYALTIIAPFAFIAYGVPSMQQWFAKWWDQFIRQVFVLPIIVIAMALLIKYAGALGFAVNPEGVKSLEPTSILYAVLVLVAATLILKLPGLITKGALDITAAAKKAFGYAKATPVTMYGAGQGALGGMKKRYEAKAGIASAAGNTELANKYKGIAKRWGTGAGYFGAARGRAYIAANPDKTLKEWWSKRTAHGEKESALEAVKVKVPRPQVPPSWKQPWKLARIGSLSGLVEGPAEYKDLTEKLAEQIANVRDLDGANNLLKIGGKDAEVLDAAMTEKLIALPKAEQAKYRARLSGASTKTAKQEDFEKIMNDLGLATEVRGNHAAQFFVAAKYGGIESAVKKLHGKNTTTRYGEEWDEFETGKPRSPKNNTGDPDDAAEYDDDGGAAFGGGTPGVGGGGATFGTGSGGGVHISTDEVSIDADKQFSPTSGLGFNQARDLMGALRPLDADKRDEHRGKLDELSSRWQSFEGQDISNPENLNLEDQQALASLVTETKSILNTTLTDQAHELQGVFNQHLDHPSEFSAASLRQLTAGLGEVIGESPESTQRIIARQNSLSGHAAVLDQAGSQWIASKSDQEINEMVKKIMDQQGGLQTELSEELGAPMGELLKANGQKGTPDEVRQITNSMVGTLSNILTGQNPRSLVRQMRSMFSNMGTDVAKKISYSSANQPDIDVRVELGKPNVVIQPPTSQPGGSTIINNNTTEISQSTSPIAPAASAGTESIASRFRGARNEPPSVELPEVPPTKEPPPTANP